MSLSETATQAPQPANVLLEVNDLRVTFCFNFIGDGLRDALDPKDR